MIRIAGQRDMGAGAFAPALGERGLTSWAYLGEDTTWRVRTEATLPPAISRVPLAELLDRAARKLRRPFIDLIGSLSARNDHFSWWSSELAAKNPYSFLFARICLLAAARDLVSGGPLPGCMVCSTPAMAAVLRDLLDRRGIAHEPLRPPLARRLGDRVSLPSGPGLRSFMDRFPVVPEVGTISSLYGQYLDTRLEWRRKVLGETGQAGETHPFSGEKSVLLVTWIDNRNFGQDGSYRDPNFGPLPRLLAERGYSVAYLGRVLPTISFRAAAERLAGCGERVYLPEMFLVPRDRAGARRAAAGFAPDIPAGIALDGLPVEALLREQVEENRRVHAETLLYRPLLRRMAETGVTPARIIHTCEGHSWEAALAWAVREYLPGTGITGYDNVTFSRMVTSMYPAAAEFGTRPLPDRVVTNGPLSCRVLRREGWPAERVVAGCGLRHGYLWEKGPGATPAGGSAPGVLQILVATAIGLGDSVELIAKAALAFGGDPGCRVTLKCHPMVSIPGVQAILGDALGHENLMFSQDPLDVLLPASHLLLYTYTSVCFEALRYGVVPVFVLSENFLNMDKLDGVPHLRYAAADAADLRRIAGEIRARGPGDRAGREAAGLGAVRDALAPVTGECVGLFLGDAGGPCGDGMPATGEKPSSGGE
ncbi:MAG TPA: hypothetical protein VMB35_08555 [Methanomicrobiales archaeon]|nr:hypothetical protein [Methanomicrobiales archaeon]